MVACRRPVHNPAVDDPAIGPDRSTLLAVIPLESTDNA